MYFKSENVLWRTIDDDILLLNVTNGHYYSLDSIGGRIWLLLVEGLEREAIVSRLQDEYAGEEMEIHSAVQDLIEDLLLEKLITLEPELQPV
jgi:hypothetical protein